MTVAATFAAGFFARNGHTATAVTANFQANGIVQATGLGVMSIASAQRGDAVRIAGATTGGNNGDFTLLGIIDDDTVVLDHTFTAEAPGAATAQIFPGQNTLTITDEDAIDMDLIYANASAAKGIVKCQDLNTDTGRHEGWQLNFSNIDIVTTVDRDVVWDVTNNILHFTATAFTPPDIDVSGMTAGSTFEWDMGALEDALDNESVKDGGAIIGLGHTNTDSRITRNFRCGYIGNGTNGSTAFFTNGLLSGLVVSGYGLIRQLANAGLTIRNLIDSSGGNSFVDTVGDADVDTYINTRSTTQGVFTADVELSGVKFTGGSATPHIRTQSVGPLVKLTDPILTAEIQERSDIATVFTTSAVTFGANRAAEIVQYTYNPRIVRADFDRLWGEGIALSGADVKIYRRDREPGIQGDGSVGDGDYTFRVKFGATTEDITYSSAGAESFLTIFNGIRAAFNAATSPVTAVGTFAVADIPMGIQADVEGTPFTLEIISDPSGGFSLLGVNELYFSGTTDANGRIDTDGVKLERATLEPTTVRQGFVTDYIVEIRKDGYEAQRFRYTPRAPYDGDIELIPNTAFGGVRP